MRYLRQSDRGFAQALRRPRRMCLPLGRLSSWRADAPFDVGAAIAIRGMAMNGVTYDLKKREGLN